MFVDQTLKRNKALIDTAFAFHQSGQVLPDSYMIDVDAFVNNAAAILKEAEKHHFRMYFMLKQVGRNPYLAKKLIELGYAGAVVVDFKEAQIMMDHNIPIGNVGHLVQVPSHMLSRIIAYGPEVMTVYSMEKIREINRAAGALNKKQGILIRVFREKDMIYSGQTAGFSLDVLPETVEEIRKNCPNVIIRGITSFPCYLYNEEKKDIAPTENLATVLKAKEILEGMGFEHLIVNTPSATCVNTIQKMAEAGGNCGEPGHGLTGTTPMHAWEEQTEIPAVVYISEISHNFLGKAYCYGGGHYRRSHADSVLTGTSTEDSRRLKVIPPSDESIDYHFGISEECRVGDTAVMAFRFQIFVTRSDVVLVEGIQKGQPEIVGIYDSLGRVRK